METNTNLSMYHLADNGSVVIGPKGPVGFVDKNIDNLVHLTAKTVFMLVDWGSGGPSARIICFAVSLFPQMGDKIEPNKGEKVKDFLTRIFIIAEENGIIDVFLLRSAWARLQEGHPDYASENVPAKIVEIEENLRTHASYFRIISKTVSQIEEGNTAQTALLTNIQAELELNPDFLGNINLEDCEAGDIGNRSRQGPGRVQSREFGGFEIRDRLKSEQLAVVQESCNQQYLLDTPRVPNGVHKVLFLCGAHLFSIKDQAVLAELKKMHYEMTYKENKTGQLEAILDGKTPLKAADLLAAMESAILTYNKTDKAVYGLVATIAEVKAYMTNRGTEVVRLGEWKSANGQDRKASHYLGAAIDFYKRFFVQSIVFKN